MPNGERERGPSAEQRLAITSADITVAIIAVIILLAIVGAYLSGLLEIYRKILDWIYSRNWQAIKRVLMIIFVLLDGAFVALIIYSIQRLRELKKKPPEKKAVAHAVLPKEEVRESWEQIRQLANSENPSDWNMAVLRADALLEDILLHLGYEGATLAERLKIADPSQLPSLDRIWSAHRLRNLIAHDPIEQHARETIIQALRSYEQALKELGMMEEIK